MAPLRRLLLGLGGAAVLYNGADANGVGCELSSSLCGEREISNPDVPAGMGCHDQADNIQWNVSSQEECEGIPMLWKPFLCATVQAQLDSMPDCEMKKHWSRTCCENLEELGGSRMRGVTLSHFACHRTEPWPFRRLQDERAVEGPARRLNGNGPRGPPASPEREPGTQGVEAHIEQGEEDTLYEPNDVNCDYMFFGYANGYPLYRNSRKREIFLIHSGDSRGEARLPEDTWHVALWKSGEPHPKSIANLGMGTYRYHLSADDEYSERWWTMKHISCGNFYGEADVSIRHWQQARPCVDLPPHADEDPSRGPVPVGCDGLKEQKLPAVEAEYA